MLHIYFNSRTKDDRADIDPETFQSRIVFFDLFVTEMTQFVISIENKESAIQIFRNVLLIRCKKLNLG